MPPRTVACFAPSTFRCRSAAERKLCVACFPPRGAALLARFMAWIRLCGSPSGRVCFPSPHRGRASSSYHCPSECDAVLPPPHFLAKQKGGVDFTARVPSCILMHYFILLLSVYVPPRFVVDGAGAEIVRVESYVQRSPSSQCSHLRPPCGCANSSLR